MVANDTVGNGGREQTLDSTEDSNGDGWSYQSLDGLPRQSWHYGTRQLRIDAETVADGLDGGDACILFQKQGADGNHDDGNQ